MTERGIACVCAALILAVPATAQVPSRDLPRKAPLTGTASLSGVVRTDDTDARPLRRVRVFLSSRDAEVTRTTISDDAGRFAFTDLPPGRYSVGGTKDGYVTVNYGAKRPGRAGTPIKLDERQALADLTLRLPRGAVITGVLLDVEGQPLPGVSMRALRSVFTSGGERRLAVVNTGTASHITDDRGVYRIFGLAAGEYVIAAPARMPGPSGAEVLLMTDADVRRALEEVRQPGRQPIPPPSAAATASAADEAPRVGYAPVFYPGTTVAAQAATITVAQAEERGDVNFQLQFVPMSTVRGTILAGEGMFSEYMTVYLIANRQAILAAADEDVRAAGVNAAKGFTFTNVPPGQYTLLARGTRGPGGGAPVFWASTDVIIDGQRELDVTLSLQPGLTLTGRIAFEGTAPLPDATRVRVSLTPVLAGSQVSLGTTPVQADAAGRFTITGITAARYRLQASLPGAPGWTLKSAIVSGKDTLDLPLDLRQSIDGALVTFTDRPGEVAGVVRDTSGAPVPGSAVILFAAERTVWTPMSRRIRASPSAADGTFTFANVPAGEYLIAALTDIDDGEWYDPAILERLSHAATRLTLAEGEKKTQDLRMTDR